MDDTLFFRTEAIINWPKITTKNYDGKTIEKFSCALYFTKENYENNLKKVLEYAKKEHKKAKLSLKLIEEERPELLEIMGKEYIYQYQAGSQTQFIKCKDLYKNDLSLNDLKSGDRVYVKGCLKESKNPENPSMRYITMYISSIAKLEDQVYDIRVNNDKDFDDALDSYRMKYGVENTDPDNNDDDDIPEWEK